MDNSQDTESTTWGEYRHDDGTTHPPTRKTRPTLLCVVVFFFRGFVVPPSITVGGGGLPLLRFITGATATFCPSGPVKRGPSKVKCTAQGNPLPTHYTLSPASAQHSLNTTQAEVCKVSALGGIGGVLPIINLRQRQEVRNMTLQAQPRLTPSSDLSWCSLLGARTVGALTVSPPRCPCHSRSHYTLLPASSQPSHNTTQVEVCKVRTVGTSRPASGR